MSTHRQIAKYTGIISFFTFLSRITGLIRDAAVAYIFGTALSADAFYVAFRIPNLFRSLLAEGSLTQAFVPVFTETYKKDPGTAKALVDSAFTVLFSLLVVVVVLGILASDALVSVIARGYADEPEKLSLTISLTRVLFPYLGLVSLMALAMGVLNSLKRFAAPAFAPILFNIGMIMGALLFSRWIRPPIYGLAIGALLGGLFQVLCQFPALIRSGFLPRFVRSFSHPALARVGRLMLPALYGSAVYQINVFAITYFASLLGEGAVSILWYAGRIMEFPLGVFAIAVATAILPSFSEHAAERDPEKFKSTLLFGLEMIVFINLPAAIGLYLLSEPITVLLLHRGAFNETSAIETARALQAFAVGLPFISGVRVLVSAYYALERSKIPVVMATLAVVANIVSCLLLAKPLGHVGLALATSIGSTVNFIGLLVLLPRYLGAVSFSKLGIPCLRVIAGSAVMAVGLMVVYRFLFADLFAQSFPSTVLDTLLAIAFGTGLYCVANLRNPLLQATFTSIKRRFGR